MGLTEPISDGISAGPMVAKLTDPLGIEDEGSGLLGRTQAFRDRVKAENGIIEGGSLENLYDPILRAFKGFSGVGLSDLPFFGSGSAVKINSGAIPMLFDSSGGENDATQSDTAKQPTDALIGSKVALYFDGSDDILTIPFQLITGSQNPTIFIVLKTQHTSDKKIVEAAGTGGINSDDAETATPSTEYGIRVTGGNEVYNTSPSGSKELLTLRQNGPDVIDFQAWVNGSELSVSSSSNITTDYESGSKSWIGGWSGGPQFDGKIGSYLVTSVPLSNTNKSKIESILQDYYSI